MDKKMFCYQCEQTVGCTGCTGNAGVCGKKAGTAKLQDELTGALIGLARAVDSAAAISKSTSQVIIEGLFTTVTNVSFDDAAIENMIQKVRADFNTVRTKRIRQYGGYRRCNLRLASYTRQGFGDSVPHGSDIRRCRARISRRRVPAGQGISENDLKVLNVFKDFKVANIIFATRPKSSIPPLSPTRSSPFPTRASGGRNAFSVRRMPCNRRHRMMSRW